jgi:thiosulfate/3-mercaptopyruvate sulfurtransferase
MKIQLVVAAALAAQALVAGAPLWAGASQEGSLPDNWESLELRDIRRGSGEEIILDPPATGLAALPEDQANFDSFIWSVEKLKANYDKTVIIDARAPGPYNSEHLPGAFQIHWKDAVADKYNTPPSDSEIGRIFAGRGIDLTKTIVVYNDPLVGNAEETRILWLLRYIGITDSYVLNGGIRQWKAQGGETTNDKTPKSALTPLVSFQRNERLFISTSEIASRLGSLNLFDTRGDEEFAKSRIPGAKFAWFKDFYHKDGSYFTPAETRARIAGFGFNKDDEVAVYCQGGIRSSLLFVLLQTAGFSNVRNYCASFSGWSGTDQTLDAASYPKIPAYK